MVLRHNTVKNICRWIPHLGGRVGKQREENKKVSHLLFTRLTTFSDTTRTSPFSKNIVYCLLSNIALKSFPTLRLSFFLEMFFFKLLPINYEVLPISTVPTTSVQGVLAKQAQLPCDISPMDRNDVVFMVLWFREGDGEPLYRYWRMARKKPSTCILNPTCIAPFSFDVRAGNPAQAKLWSSPTAFANRAYFRTTSHPAQLLVDDIQLTDEGVYRCRVDFRNSPTRNMKINFTVIGTSH